MPDRAWRAEQFERHPDFWKDPDFHVGELRQVGFGKGALLTTPLQVARLMAVVANGGRLVRPTLLLGEGVPGKTVADARSIALVRAGMESVVDRGTAARIGLGRFRVAGKTGTGEVVARRKQHMAWFAGYAPREAPRVAFACVVHNTSAYGAAASGPVVRAFLAEYLGE
jgi:penicillin-binding protein 2